MTCPYLLIATDAPRIDMRKSGGGNTPLTEDEIVAAIESTGRVGMTCQQPEVGHEERHRYVHRFVADVEEGEEPRWEEITYTWRDKQQEDPTYGADPEPEPVEEDEATDEADEEPPPVVEAEGDAGVPDEDPDATT